MKWFNIVFGSLLLLLIVSSARQCNEPQQRISPIHLGVDNGK
jgi:hypothetical protein